MANITIKDLSAYSYSGSFIHDLSEEELDLQGGHPLLVAYLIYEAASAAWALYNISQL
jgi:hypothetical protein